MRFICRHMRHKLFKHFVHNRFRLSDRKSSDSVPRKIHIAQYLCAFNTKVGEHASLHDSEQSLILARVTFLAALCPAMCSVHGSYCIAAVTVSRCAFIKRHCNIRTESLLNFHYILRCEKHFMAVNMRAEFDSLLMNFVH